MNSEYLEYFKGNYNFVLVVLILSFFYFYLSESPKTYQQKQKHQSNSIKNCAFVSILVTFALWINLSSEFTKEIFNTLDVDLISHGAKSVIDDFIPGPATF